jgi:PAS domain S-box-containing protein
MTIRSQFYLFLAAALVIIVNIFPLAPVYAGVSPERISIAYCKDSVPFHFSDDSGRPAGIIIDLWRLWSEKTGISIDFQEAAWDDTLTMVGSGTADVHAGLFFNKERDKFLDYGVALTKTDTHYFMHVTLPSIKEIDGLAPYRVGVLGSDYVERYLKERLPEGTVMPFPDYDAIMKALKEGRLKVFAADTPTGLFHLAKNGLLPEFTFVSEKPLYQNDFFFAVREGNQALIEVINRGTALITDEEKRDINRRWIASGVNQGKNIIISIDRTYAPLTFVNALGRPSGLFVDLWRTWAEKTGRKIQFRASGWTETLDGLRAGEVDIHSGLSFSKERAEWIDFSTQIYETFTKVYHRAGDNKPTAIDDYEENVVGTQFGTYQDVEFRKAYPNISVRSFVNNRELIDALLKGEIKAIVQEEMFMEAELDRLGLRGDITARPERLFPSTVHAGVLKGNVELLNEINSGFAAIAREKLAEIEKRWVPDTEHLFYKLDTASIVLSPDEASWLKDHPAIRIGVMDAWPPINFVDEKGVPRGIGADYIAALNRRLGNRLVIEPAPFKENFEKVKDRQLDALMDITPKKEREAFFEFTRSYLTIPHVYTGRKDGSYIDSAEELFGRTIALEKGYYNVRLFRKNYPQVTIKEYPSTAEALEAVSKGEADAYAGNRAVVMYLIEQKMLSNLAVQGRMKKPPVELNIGVRKDWQILAGILDKALGDISPAEEWEIHRRWIGEKRTEQLGLTGEEEKFLATHQEFSLGIDPSWAPFEFIDENGKYSGISSGYVKAIADRLEVEMRPVPGLTWSQVVEKAKAGEVDVLPAMVPSRDREAYLAFSKPYLSPPIIIAVYEKMSYANELKDLSGYKVGVVKDYFTDESLTRDYPDLKLIKFSTLKEGLKALDEGELDAFVDSLAAITSEIALSGFRNIKISAPTQYNFDMAFGVRKDWPELVSILNKTIDDISDQERMLIKNTWTAPVEVKYGIDLKRILIWVVPMGISVVLIIIFVFIWNRRLTMEVTERKRTEERFYALLESAPDAMIVSDETGDIMLVNSQTESVFGYPREELIGKKIEMLVPEEIRDKHPDHRESFYADPKRLSMGFRGNFFGIAKDGQKIPIDIGLSPIKKDNGLLVVASIRDITERKRMEETISAERERLQGILDVSPIGVAISIKGKIRFANPRHIEMMGVGIGDKTPDLYVHPEERDVLIKKLATEGKVANYELQMYNRDRQIMDLLVSYLPITYQDEEGILVWLLDITEMKAAEKAIKESEARIKTIFDSINTGIIVIDPEDRTIVDANPITEQMIGLPKKEIVGSFCYRFICPREMNDCPIIDHGQTVDSADRVLLSAEGREIPILKTVVRVILGGKPHLVESFVDLTERKRAEAELQRNMEELERFNKLTISREEKMIALKEEINELLCSMGKPLKYKIVE